MEISLEVGNLKENVLINDVFYLYTINVLKFLGATRYIQKRPIKNDSFIYI